MLFRSGEAKDPNGVGLIDDFDALLGEECAGTRPGFLDIKLSVLIAELDRMGATRKRPRATVSFERAILAALRDPRAAVA